MSDRHKYRVWVEETKKYILPGCKSKISIRPDGTLWIGLTQLKDGYNIELCTGLFAAKSYRGDKPEDLLIFEGDILKLYRSCPDAKYTIIRNVYFDFDEAGFYVKDYPERPMGTSIIHPAKKEWCERTEIIGTIHDKEVSE